MSFSISRRNRRPLSIGLAACLNAALLYRGLRRHDVYHPQPGWGRFAAKLAIALAVMGGGLWFAAGADADWLRWGLAERLARLTALTTLGAAAYFATLWALGFRLNDFKRRAA